MVKRIISKVFLIITSIALLQILGTIILARNLPKHEMGLYRLILTVVDLGVITSLLGIDHSFVRFFSSPDISFEKYNWRFFLKRFSPFSFLILLILAATVTLVYKFSFFVASCLIILLTMLTSIFIFTSFLRSGGKYGLAIFLSRLNFLLFFILLLALYFLKDISFKNALSFYVLAAILANSIVVYYSFKNTPCGENPIPASVLKNGFYYFGIGASIILILQTSYLFIGKMLTLKDLAVYAVVASIMRIFEFTQDSLYYVLAPYLNTKTDVPAKRIFLILLYIGAGLALIYLLAGRIIVHILFKGLYDEGVYLIPFFAGIGLVRTLYILPASILGGRTSGYTLRNQFCLAILAAILNICLTYIFIKKWQLQGAAIASLITWVVLFIMAFSGARKHIIYNEGVLNV